MTDVARFTTQMQAMLPQWMKMAKDPSSVGAQFLNVFGIELDQVQSYLDDILGNQFIDTADLGQVDITYKVPLSLPKLVDFSAITTVIGHKDIDSYNVSIVPVLRDFYAADASSSVAIIDRQNGLLYIRPQSALINSDLHNPFDSVDIDGTTHYDIILHHIWNAFDEFGLLLGIARLYGERNAAFKTRILDVFANPGGASKEGIINGLARELGINKMNVELQELSDPAFKGTLLNEDGSASQRLKGYAEQANKVLGFTWDNMSWDEAYWHSLEDNNLGFDYLPHVWDASLTTWKEEQIQSGIGDGDDLLVTAPIKQDNERSFKYYVGLRGSEKDGQLIYPEHSFKYKITAQGTIVNQTSKPQDYKYTVIASEIMYLYFVIRAFQQYQHTELVDFSSMSGFIFDSASAPNLEVVTGKTMMSPKASRFLELYAYMATTNRSATPSLNSLTVNWKDTANGTHSFIFDTQADFDRNDTTVQTTKQNTISTAAGSIELGYGDFYHVINTKGDFEKGTTQNVTILPEGTIRLVPLTI